jgi:hypothetical protein
VADGRVEALRDDAARAEAVIDRAVVGTRGGRERERDGEPEGHDAERYGEHGAGVV